jgi:hypothetical protein
VKNIVGEECWKTDAHLNITNINTKIAALENYAYEIKSLYSSQPDIIINFRKRANDIKNEIEMMSDKK